MAVRCVLCIWFFFQAFSGMPQPVDGEVELSGFLIGQYRVAVHKQLGPPLKRIDTNDGWIYEFHKAKPDTSVYMLFKYAAFDTVRIYSMQLNGESFDNMQPFKGLKLGASRSEVDRALGTRYSRIDSA